MRFLVDECAGPLVAAFLEGEGHTVFCVYTQARGAKDVDILAKAAAETWVLVTADKDFGDLVYRDGRSHQGVVLLRLADERAASKIAVLTQLLRHYSDRLPGSFVVATEDQVRFSLTSVPPTTEGD